MNGDVCGEKECFLFDGPGYMEGFEGKGRGGGRTQSSLVVMMRTARSRGSGTFSIRRSSNFGWFQRARSRRDSSPEGHGTSQRDHYLCVRDVPLLGVFFNHFRMTKIRAKDLVGDWGFFFGFFVIW